MGRSKIILDKKDPDILNKIAEEIKKGIDPIEFEDILDEILGTGLPAVDLEKDRLWQTENRKSKVGR